MTAFKRHFVEEQVTSLCTQIPLFNYLQAKSFAIFYIFRDVMPGGELT